MPAGPGLLNERLAPGTQRLADHVQHADPVPLVLVVFVQDAPTVDEPRPRLGDELLPLLVQIHDRVRRLDGPGGDAVAAGDLGVGQRGSALGLVGGEEHERALDGLGAL
jgi:hypothetical protein